MRTMINKKIWLNVSCHSRPDRESRNRGNEYLGSHFRGNDKITNLTRPALVAAMSAVFISGLDGAVLAQDSGAAEVPAAHVVWGKQVEGNASVFEETPPAWALGAYRVGQGGKWETSPVYCWHVPGGETNYASLNIDLDRKALPSGNIQYWLYFFDSANSGLQVSLLDTNGLALAAATNLFGNLMRGSNVETVVRMDIPLPKEAAVIQLKREGGEARVFESLVMLGDDGADLQGQARAAYYYVAGTGISGGVGQEVQGLAGLGAKAKGGNAGGGQSGNRKGLRSLAGARKDTMGAVNLKVYTHLE